MFIKYKSVLLSLITHTQIEIVKLSGHTSLIKAIIKYMSPLSARIEL